MLNFIRIHSDTRETRQRSATAGLRSATALAVVAAALAAIAAGCQKADSIPTTSDRLKTVQVKQETQPDFFVPRKSVDYMSDLKNIKDAPAKPEPAKAAPARVAKPLTPPPPVLLPVVTAPARAAEPPVQVAIAAPTARPLPVEDPGRVSVLSREQPVFPKEAMRKGVESAMVQARLTIGAAGNVTAVTIVQARPPRIFDASVKESLLRWKFNPGADGRSYETEVSFKLQ